MTRSATIGIIIATILLIPGCGGGGGGGGGGTLAELTIGFERIADVGLDPVLVRVDIVGGDGSAPTLEVDHGSIGPAVAAGGGWEATLTPDGTGEYRITARLGGASASRSALVLAEVHADWGQPEAVAGLVNTPGYEDGATITPDGRYLFVQYGPYRWSSLLVFNAPRVDGGCGGDRLSPTRCDHPWIDGTIGPMGAPERPGFFTGRFDGTRQRHNAVSWGMADDTVPILALSTMFFGFERQADGSFGQPFTLAFDDLGDGIIGPFGLGFQPLGGDAYRATFTLKDTATTDAGFDLYRCDLTAGGSTTLGTYVATTPGNPPARGSDFPSLLVDLGDNTGTQGNAFPSLDAAGAVRSIWTDDEYDGDADTHQLTVHVPGSGAFPSTADWASSVLPDVVNVPGTEAIQPCFEDDGLYFTQDTSIAFAAYSGSHDLVDFATAGNWSAPQIILGKDLSLGVLDAADIGRIVALGEASIAVIDGRRTLFFVYVTVRGFDPITGIADLDFQVGQVSERAPAPAASG